MGQSLLRVDESRDNHTDSSSVPLLFVIAGSAGIFCYRAPAPNGPALIGGPTFREWYRALSVGSKPGVGELAALGRPVLIDQRLGDIISQKTMSSPIRADATSPLPDTGAWTSASSETHTPSFVSLSWE